MRPVAPLELRFRPGGRRAAGRPSPSRLAPGEAAVQRSVAFAGPARNGRPSRCPSPSPLRRGGGRSPRVNSRLPPEAPPALRGPERNRRPSRLTFAVTAMARRRPVAPRECPLLPCTRASRCADGGPPSRAWAREAAARRCVAFAGTPHRNGRPSRWPSPSRLRRGSGRSPPRSSWIPPPERAGPRAGWRGAALRDRRDRAASAFLRPWAEPPKQSAPPEPSARFCLASRRAPCARALPRLVTAGLVARNRYVLAPQRRTRALREFAARVLGRRRRFKTGEGEFARTVVGAFAAIAAAASCARASPRARPSCAPSASRASRSR